MEEGMQFDLRYLSPESTRTRISISEPGRMLIESRSGVATKPSTLYTGVSLHADGFPSWAGSEVLHEIKFKPIGACLSNVAIRH